MFAMFDEMLKIREVKQAEESESLQITVEVLNLPEQKIHFRALVVPPEFSRFFKT